MGVISRALVDVSERGSDKKEDVGYAARNDKVSDLWRPGAGFKPTSFIDAMGPKVRGTPGLANSRIMHGMVQGGLAYTQCT